MKSQPREMIEGTEAFERLRAAMKQIVSVPKSTIGPSPYKKWEPKKTKKKPAAKS